MDIILFESNGSKSGLVFLCLKVCGEIFSEVRVRAEEGGFHLEIEC